MALSESKIKGCNKKTSVITHALFCITMVFYGLLLMHMIYAVSEELKRLVRME